MAQPMLCIHGHFYQPPREDPWLEAIEFQESAAPFDNWNARVNSECYAPNGRSRIRGAGGHIVRVANNYARMSFNFGPTLLSWLADHDAETLQRIVEGDRTSAARLDGHGNAMAQAYNHMILPLASERDRRTQVCWGLRDFRARFGRDAEGMWLPETAVDVATLETLAEQGLAFTVLAPGQAARWRPLGEGDWQQAGAQALDTRRAYRCLLPSGRHIDLFFYNGDLAHRIAFAGLLNSGDELAEALVQGAPSDDSPALLHVATDGESYGHHHRFGDMALAFALDRIEREGCCEIGNYAAFLSRYPPEWEVQIQDQSSWSCAHGIERWRSNCGCNAGTPGYHQRWRGPLRQALNALREQIDACYVREAGAIFTDPWTTRDRYIEVVLDRRDAVVDAFLRRELSVGMEASAAQRALELLEMQRHAMLMYTSCGWFFDEISGLEGTQILRYAARAIQLARRFGQDLEPNFVGDLRAAESNVAELKDGAGVWCAQVAPARVELPQVAAHFAVGAVFEQAADLDQAYAYRAELVDAAIEEVGDTHLGLGSVEVRSTITREQQNVEFAVLHFGGLDLHAWVRPPENGAPLNQVREDARRLFREASIGEVYDCLRRHFPRPSYQLDQLFARERAALIDRMLDDRVRSYRTVLAGLVSPDLGIVQRLWRMEHKLPPSLRVAVQIYIEEQIEEVLRSADALALSRLQGLTERSIDLGAGQKARLRRLLEGQIQQRLQRAHDLGDEVLQALLRLLDASQMLGLELNLWAAQNRLLCLCEGHSQWVAQNRLRLDELALRLDLDPALLHPDSLLS